MASQRGIYETKVGSEAREFNRWALSLGSGCVHGCVYCYVPIARHMPREAFHCRFDPRDKAVLQEVIRRDAGKFHRLSLIENLGTVLLCFSCDPLQPEAQDLTQWTVEQLNDHDVPATILTKAGGVTHSFLSVLSLHRKNEFAVTLTLANGWDSQTWEPRAGTPQERIYNLARADALGIPTWASLEPVIEPRQTLALLEQAAPFAGHFKVGTLNYHPHAASIARGYGWARFLDEIEDLAAKLGKRLVVKESLRKAAGRE